MQTFLPFASFERSARVLDDRRLGKQRVETLQILRALHVDGYGWANHPAVLMWRGATPALVSYGVAVIDEWRSRGYADTTEQNIAEFVHPGHPRSPVELAADGLLPPWLGWEPLHRSHRSALRRKDPDRYARYFPGTPDDLDYVWPEPPAPASEPGRRDAWAVRSTALDSTVAIPARADEHPWTPGAHRPGRITKRHRQIERFVVEMQPGDLVVVPDGADLWLATVVGEYVFRAGMHVREVRRHGAILRRDLRFPAALQDPQVVFPLRDEPLLRRRRPS